MLAVYVMNRNKGKINIIAMKGKPVKEVVSEESDDDSNMEEEDETYIKEDQEDKEDRDIEKVEDSDIKEKEDQKSEEENGPPMKKRKVSKKELYKPPTNEELNQLKETQNLYHSSLFRLQIVELLKEVQLKKKRQSQIARAITEVTSLIKSLKKSVEHDIKSQKWLKEIQVPVHQSPINVKGKFHFSPPVEIHVVGSYLTGTCIKPDVTVDLAVVIPKECFQGKDYLNHRYVRKKALYLAVVAKRLHEKHGMTDMKYTYQNGNSLKPCLLLNYQGEEEKPVCFSLIAVPEEGIFKLNRFHIYKNNVRKQWFDGKETDDDNTENQPPTPFYNNTILKDLSLIENTKHLKKITEESPGIRDGIALLKVWLRQRELSHGFGGFSGFIISMYVLYLVNQRKINHMMSGYQVMRNTFLNLSQTDWTKDAISLCTVMDAFNQPDPCLFFEHFSVVFVDHTGYVNFCSDVSKGIYDRVRQEAELALQYLESHHLDSFTALFMTPVTFLQKFDIILHIHNTNSLASGIKKLRKEDKLVDYNGNYVHALKSDILSLVCQSLNDRASIVQYRQHSVPVWGITERPPSYDGADTLVIGLQLNPLCAFNILEKGPAADTLEAKEFLNFWGDKSELRRFKDGSICEAVAWTDKQFISDKRIICGHIVQHILNRHLGIDTKSVKCLASQLDCLLKYTINSKFDGPDFYGTGEEHNNDIIQRYDELCKILRNLSDLPLSISSIQGSSPVFRYTEVFPPLPATAEKPGEMEKGKYKLPKDDDKNCPDYIMSLKVICLLEGSGKWPDEKKAFDHLMAAFHIKLADALKNQHGLLTAVFPRHVDVLKNNYVFRIVLGYTREIALKKMIKTPEGMVKYKDNDEAVELEKEIQGLPKLTSTLHGLQQMHGSFSGTVRLAKRWISSQLLTDYVGEEATEILVAHLYLHPAPYTVPSTPLVGFQRFLYLLCHHDWKTLPLMINLNNDFTDEDWSEIPSRFNEERQLFPLMFLSTPYDRYSSHWTKKFPTAPLLQRLIILAKQSLQVLTNQMNNGNIDSSIKQIFRPPLELYDVIIQLIPRQVPRYCESVDSEGKELSVNLKNYKKKINLKLETSKPETRLDFFPVYDYDPVKLYVDELRENYGEFAMFFYDKYGGQYVAVLLKPGALVTHEFKVPHMNCRMVTDKTKNRKDIQLVLNMDAMLNDFRLIGKGLVAGVKRNAQKT